MNTILIDIFDEYFNCAEGKFGEIKHRYAINIKSELSGNALKDRIRQLIFENKGDGFSISNTNINDVSFINIFLYVNEGTNYDISYLIDYLESNFEIINVLDNYNFTYSHSLLISIHKESVDIIDQILNDLFSFIEQENIDYSIINQKNNRYSPGADNEMVTYLISVGTGLTVEIIKYLYIKLKEFKNKDKWMSNIMHIALFDPDKLKNNLKQYIGVNTNDLFIDSFTELSDNLYLVVLKNRYNIYEIKCNNKSEILELQSKSLTQTQI